MKKHKIRNWFLGSLAVILLLVLSLQATLYFFGDEILKKSILLGFQRYSEQAFEPNRQPQLNFDNLSLNIFNGNFSVSGLFFSGYLPSQPGQQGADYIRLTVPEASIEGMDLIGLYQSRQVFLERITFHQPDIQLVKAEKADSLSLSPKESIELSTRSLHQLLRLYIKSLSFNVLQVEDGNLFVTRQSTDIATALSGTGLSNQFHAEHVYIRLQDFLLDSLSLEQKDRFFFTKEFEVQLGDYQLLLPDSTYLIRADTLGYSTQSEEIYLKRFQAIPLQGMSDQRISLDFRVPEIRLTEVDWKEIYFDSLFNASLMIIDQPRLDLKTYQRPDSVLQRSAPRLSRLSTDRIYGLIDKKIKRLSVKDIKLQNGAFNIQQIGQDTLDLLQIGDINVLLAHISLDTLDTAIDSLSAILPADTVEIDLHDVKLYLPDREHYITAASVRLSTNRQRGFVCDVLLDSLNFKPGVDSLEQLLHEPPGRPLAYDVFIPFIRFDGIQLQTLANEQAALLDSIYISRPDIRIANFSVESLGKQASGLTSLATTNNEAISENVKSLLYDWSHARLNLAPFIAAGDSLALLQWLRAGKLQLDSGRVSVLRADTLTDQFIPITSVDTFYAFLNNIRIDHLPDDSVWRSYDGRVAVRATDVDVFLQAGEFRLPGEKGEGGIIRVEDARVSTLSQEVYFRNIYFWTNPGMPPNTDLWLHSMYIPYVHLKDIALQKFYLEQVAEAGSLSAYSPVVKLNYRRQKLAGNAISFDYENLYPQFAPYLNRISLRSLLLNQAEILLQQVSSSRVDTIFSAQGVDLRLKNFYLDSLTRMSPLRPFYAHTLDLKMKDYRWNFQQQNELFRALKGRSLHYNSYEGQMDAVGLEMVTNTAASPTKDRLKLNARKIMADDVDPYRLIHDQSLHVGRLIIQKPSFILEERAGNKEKVNADTWQPLQPDMNQLLSEQLKNINLRFVHVEEGALTYFKKNTTDTLTYIRLDSVDFIARKILVNGDRRRHLHKILYADDVDYSILSGELFFNSDEKHQIRAEKALLSSRDSRIQIRGVSVKPSAGLIRKVNQAHINFSSDDVLINGIDLHRAYLYGDLSVQKLTPRQPTLRVFLPEKEDGKNRKASTIHEIISPYLNKVSIDEIQYPRSSMAFTSKKDGKEVFSSPRISATVYGFSLDEQALKQEKSSNGLFFAENLLVDIEDFEQTVDDGLYRIAVDGVSIRTADRQLRLQNIRLQSQIEKNAYLQKFKYRKSLISAYLDQVLVEGMDYDALLNDEKWLADRILIQDPVLEVYTDKRLPRDESKRRALHQQFLLNMENLIKVGEVQISNGFISYAEKADESEQAGIISFQEVNASLQNISNLPSDLDIGLVTTLKANALVMGEGDLSATFRFPLSRNDLNFSVSGKLGQMDLIHFNRILEPVAFVHIKEGVCQEMNFNFSGNEQKTTGTMEFRYNDLSVLMIDKEKGQAGLEEKLGSFIANAFVLKASNPKAVFLRIGNIEYERDESKAMFHYWWQSILSGVKSSIGLEKNMEKTKDFSRIEDGQ
jgi:hypothetical protein